MRQASATPAAFLKSEINVTCGDRNFAASLLNLKPDRILAYHSKKKMRLAAILDEISKIG